MDCPVCNNTRKVEFENEITTCPVCEEYVAWHGGDENGSGSDSKRPTVS